MDVVHQFKSGHRKWVDGCLFFLLVCIPLQLTWLKTVSNAYTHIMFIDTHKIFDNVQMGSSVILLNKHSTFAMLGGRIKQCNCYASLGSRVVSLRRMWVHTWDYSYEGNRGVNLECWPCACTCLRVVLSSKLTSSIHFKKHDKGLNPSTIFEFA